MTQKHLDEACRKLNEKIAKRGAMGLEKAQIDLINKRPPEIMHVQYAHDDWCNKLNGKGECNCNPDVTYYTEEELRQLYPGAFAKNAGSK